MGRHAVLCVHDAVIAADVAEILVSRLGPLDVKQPKGLADVAMMIDGAVCLVTDSRALEILRRDNLVPQTPHLHIGDEPPAELPPHTVFITLPFTNETVEVALSKLRLRDGSPDTTADD